MDHFFKELNVPWFQQEKFDKADKRGKYVGRKSWFTTLSTHPQQPCYVAE